MLKGKMKTSTGDTNTTEAPQFRENAQINAKIDDYIRNNPKRWEYIQGMSKDRMARTIVLKEVQDLDRQQRIHQGVNRKLDKHPELKDDIDNVLKHYPEDQREKVRISLASQALRS